MLALSAFFIFLSIAMAAYYFLVPQENIVRRRLLQGDTMASEDEEEGLQGGPFKRLVWPALTRLGYRTSRLLPKNFITSIEETLVASGSHVSVGSFFAFWLTILGFCALVFLVIVRVNPDLGFTKFFLVGAFLGGFGLFTPLYLVKRRARVRRREIERGMPDALDLLLTSVEAGLAVDAAFALVVAHQTGPLAEVFTSYLRQIGLGQSRKDALSDVANRTGVISLVKLATTVAQATEVGTSMGDVLRLQAADMRAERRVRAQEAAQKAPVKMVIPLALCFLPAMVAVVIVPSMINLLHYLSHLGGQ